MFLKILIAKEKLMDFMLSAPCVMHSTDVRLSVKFCIKPVVLTNITTRQVTHAAVCIPLVALANVSL